MLKHCDLQINWNGVERMVSGFMGHLMVHGEKLSKSKELDYSGA